MDTAVEMNACFQNPQNVLAEAVQKGDVDGFRAALRMGASPGAEDPKAHLSVFEKLCRTKDSGELIEICLQQNDVDVNKINAHFKKSPINFVAESKNYSNLKALLSVPGVDVNRPVNGMTPLLKLVQSLSEDSMDEITKCIKLLVNYGADVNYPNQQNVTPIIALLQRLDKLSDPEPLVRFFLSHPRLDVDTHRNGEARQLLAEHFPQLHAPASQDGPVTYERLRQLLKNEMEDLFLEQIRTADAKNVIEVDRSQDENLLIAATESGLHRALTALVPLCDVNAGGRKCPLKLACQRGEWRILEELLKAESINLNFNKCDPLLSIVVKKLGEKGLKGRCDYHKCFQLLIQDSRVDVNEVDVTGSTALHYAVKYKNEAAIKSLLDKSAYIGLENRFKEIPIVDIDVNILKKHLDRCINVNNLRPGDTNYQIHLDYSNLNMNFDAKSKHPYGEEMIPISYIAGNPELKSLLKHPLLSSFLFLKWNRLAPFFYVNLLLYTLFSLALILYLVFCYGHDVSKEWASFLWGTSIVGGIYVLVRELFQFVTAPNVYFKSVENWLEIILLTLSALVLSDIAITEENQRFVAAVLILLTSLEFAVLVGALPILSFSTHMVMLKTVFQSLLRSLAFYSIILISFALCFYTLLGGGSESNAKAPGNETESDGDFNNFVSPGMAILKTIVMMTGEFDASSINLKTPSSYSIFLLFVIFIAIVLFNLLNGLAVSDTQQIKDEAELVGLIGRAQLLARFERIIMRDSNICNRFILQNFFFHRICKRRISLFPFFLPGSQIKVLPNMSNRILIPTKKDVVVDLFKSSRARSYSEENLMASHDVERADDHKQSHMCCLFMERCTRLDGRIAKQAHAVLARKVTELESEIEKKSLNRRITRLEEKLDLILGGLYEVRNSVANRNN